MSLTHTQITRYLLDRWIHLGGQTWQTDRGGRLTMVDLSHTSPGEAAGIIARAEQRTLTEAIEDIETYDNGALVLIELWRLRQEAA